MAMSTRAKWIAQCISEIFNIGEYDAHELFRNAKHQPIFDSFLKGAGSGRVFVYYQTAYKITESGEIVDYPGREEFYVTDGEKERLKGKGLYFIRTTPPGKPVNPNGTSDNEVLVGEISDHTVTSLNVIINQVFKPLVDKLEPADWGQCEEEQKKEFTQVFEKFANELKDALKSIQSNIVLEQYDRKWDNDAKNIQTTKTPNQDMLADFERIFNEWSEKIEAALEETEGERKEDKEAGPRNEIEYWRQRMRKLTGISEQLRSKNCRTVYDVLSQASQNPAEQLGKPRDKIYLATSKWRSIELRVTEALNEAKDNVKYLSTLEKFIEPLYEGTPDSIKDTLPALMNSIKMIHTIARYYNTNDRMTGLFVKITQQMINNCKHNILHFKKIRDGTQNTSKKALSDDVMWNHEDYPPEELIPVLKSCLELNQAYQKQYEITKERLMNMPKGKQFEFSPNQIFGKFDLFCRRVSKLIELFGTIQQFRTLEKHNLENIGGIIDQFKNIVTIFRKKNHRLLDFHNNTFDRDFVEFNVDVSSVETELQRYIDKNFEVITSIEDSLKLLRKFQAILQRDNLRNSVNSKYTILFHNYGLEINQIEDQYQKYKNNPPIVRNLPTVAGSITWSRHLFHRISGPMEQFPPSLIKQKESKKFVKMYNKTGYTLFSFEYLWRQKWAHEVEKAKAGLQATLIIRHPNNNKLYVNFDSEILTLIREAKCLSRIGIDIPESAKIVLLQEDKFKMYNSELHFVLREYDRIVNKIRPNTKSLLVPHLEDLEYKLRPGMVTLTWTSMNIDGYLHHVHQGLAKLEQLIININDIMENRIENNLKTLSKTVLVNLPQDAQTFTLDDFVEMQEVWIREESQKLKSKNQEVESAVEDLIQTICSYQLDQHVEPISAEEIQKLSKYYNWSMYQALLHATKYSLNQMKERICGRRNAPKQVLKPFFEVDVHLDGDTCQLKPTLEEVQSAINRAASHVLKSTKRVQNWNQKDVPEDQREPFYDWIAKDKEIVKVILLLTGSIQGTKNNVKKFLDSFEKYNWLWKQKIDESLKRFNSKNPQLEDFEAKLKEFVYFEDEINLILNYHQIGALNLKSESVKLGLKRWIEMWKSAFSKDLHKKAKTLLEHLTDDIKQIRLKIEKPVKDIDSLGSVMYALEEIRKKESEIEIQFRPVTEMYQLLETYLPEVMDKEESDVSSILDKDWAQLVVYAETVRNQLQGQQAEFKKSLIVGINNLIVDVQDFRKNFEKNGPMVPGIEPKEALNRLRMFSDEYSVRKRKYDSYFAGEALFGLPHQSYPELEETRKEIELLDKLYSLYSKVKDTIGRWREILWVDIQSEISKMTEQIDVFSRDCMKLPGVLKTWDAYKELKQEIDDMTEILPLVEALAKPSIRPRHWDEVIGLTKEDIPYQGESFSLSQLLKANLLGFKEDIEDITDSADKQLKLEIQLREDISKYWEDAELEIKTWKGVDTPCTLGGNIQDIQDKLEEHIMALNQMNAMRFVTPFKSEVVEKISLIADVADIIEKWLKVQTLWTNLVSVFSSGDISKQMPTESKKFKTINQQWLKIMERANEQKNVIACCTNDILKNSLGTLQEGLEFCQKKLENYLESKRNIFPRFYFCSNGDLLKILSVGSDPNAVQDDFEKLFDAINHVSFDESDRRMIMTVEQTMGYGRDGKMIQEEIALIDGVKAEGNIEDWLLKLEKEMQRSVRAVCARGAKDCFSMTLREFVAAYQSQIALAGIQMLWNNKVQDCLERGQKERITELERKRKDVNNMMNELTMMCLEDMDRLTRTKVETLVTIHVHQRDTFGRILEDAKQYKIRDATDFDWVKNTRLYWKHDEEHVAVQICDVEFIYSYEFLGAKERLCITPLTDRCYITLSQALGMLYGGAPAGPAGTGKTETVKDLGRTLGIFVVVTNCSDEHKYRDMAKIFKGVCQSGLWGCFDEFNRISLATLSVVAAQVESITLAKKQGLKRFMFPNEPLPIGLIHACGYFITMNPGYAGRQELPNNLKVQFRSVSMMMPNRQVIMKVKLASVGYSTYDPLSKKFNVLYKLCEEQLSKQRHYDFGLRNILSVLRTAGNQKRGEKADADEEMIMARTLRDMNLSKFVAQDQPLFESLIRDIFPRQTAIPKKVYKEIEQAVRILLKQNNLIEKPQWVIKIIQLYETSLVRHGFMTVGPVGCGKTTINNILTDALSSIGQPHKITRMNPKSITGQQMYGVMNNVTGEWIPGVYSQIWKKCNDRKNKYTSWIQCDGPVDAIWVENLNTVLDDNRILTLANAERIPMTDNCKMTFEVGNLDNASPATVSRCGIVYVSESDLNWEPTIETWIKDRQESKTFCNPEEYNWLNDSIKKYIEKFDLFIKLVKEFTYVMYTPPVVRISMLLNLLTAVFQHYLDKQEHIDKKTFEMYFIYCLAWSIGGLFETEEREKLQKYLEQVGGPLPPISAQKAAMERETVFDYYVDPNSKTWKIWESEQWVPPKRMAFSQLLIPTIDSTRAEFIIKKIAGLPLMRSEKRKEPGQLSTLLVGGAGTAKTSVILMYTSKFDKEHMLFKRINFSSATSPYNFQEAIENEIERKQGRSYVPPGGKRMTVFLDDMSMPFVNAWGDQITLEIARQLIDHKGFYFLSKDDRGYFRSIDGLQYLGAMNHPGGGRNDIPDRLKRQFFLINMTSPSQKSIENIYGKILEQLFHPKRYSADIIAMRAPLIDATIALWDTVRKRLLPTPAKFHYVFNIRELSRVFQGICAVAQKHEYEVIKKCNYVKEKIRSELFLIGLWRHECERVFEDKLISYNDKKTFHDILDRTTKEKFRDQYQLGFEDDQLMTAYLFADFQREDKFNEYGELDEEAPFVYEAVPDIETIRKRINFKMDAYNEKFPSKKMNLVIFDDALRHLLRITRILLTPRGSCLLVGVGGSGKQSLTKLASFISKQVFFQISLTKTYGETHLKDDIKNLYREAGPLGKQVTFIMTDAEIKTEDFLESINSMLATGEIAGLIPKDERDVIALETKNIYMKEAGTKGEDPSTLELWIYFINRVRDCLHMVLAFSPVGTKFRERARKFPSLFSSCTIDWFLPWPEEALVSVSQKFLNSFPIECSKETKSQLEKHMGKVHDLVTEVCELYFQRMRRYVYVTPKSYLSFIDQYKQVYKAKFDGIDKDDVNIRNGLEKLREASDGVEELKIDLKKEEVKLKEASEITDKLLKELEVENRKARAKEDEVSQVKVKCVAQRNQIMQEKDDANRDLQIAIPFLRRAEAAVDSIKPKDITELKGVRNAVDTTRLILDTVNILLQKPLVPVVPKNMYIMKQDIPFIADSFEEYAKGTMTNSNFLNSLLDFSSNDKDNINEETVELLEPYLTMKIPSTGEDAFTGQVAKKSSAALEGMCVWAAAMSDYHKQSKIVKPKLILLDIKTASLQEAESNLAAAEGELKETQDLKAMLQRKFDDQMSEKNALQERAAKTRKKMDQANRLINSLQDNKERWIMNANEFKSLKSRLVGDVAKACAFVSYCGPFNSEFRTKLLDEYFHQDLINRNIPTSPDMELTKFLVDDATVGEWNLEGLPTDELSIQNGIMVTRSSRYPLMIDPQGQAISWIKKRERELVEKDCIFTLNHPSLKDALKFPLMDGYPVLIEQIENEVDPILDPILEKQIIIKGRNKLIKIADTDMDFDDKFRLYMTSRLANPHFSPELAAKATIIDFTVTQGGLEQQLLGRLISKEQKSLEEQLTQLQEEVTMNTKTLQNYEQMLLDRLANAQGSLLDDVELIDVLATIKNKSKEVNEKLAEGKEKRIEINEKREAFRGVAARGSVLYFCVVEMTKVNWMYNTSLQQFLGLFDWSIENAPKAQLTKDRVQNITNELTRKVYRYINRGIFERDKVMFKLMMCLKILIKEGKITSADVSVFLKSGAGVDDKQKMVNWLDQKTWLNLKAVSGHSFGNERSKFFGSIVERMKNETKADDPWRSWYNANDPENVPVPDLQEKINADQNIGHFLHMTLVRSLREDRTMLACQQFIQKVLGDEYIQPVTDPISQQWEESSCNTPVLYLLSPGADPTNNIDEFAKKKKQFPTGKVSMGEEMEKPALEMVRAGFVTGKWVILNNCHLSLEFMAQMEDILNPKGVEIHEEFRLWITCEPHPEFPLGLLQMAIKVTTEPPKGLQAGLFRTFTTMVNQDFIEKVEPYDKWRSLVFTTCFLHSIIQERRKFGALGFCIAYEFNTADLEASITYIEKHMTQCAALNIPYSWKAIQYMVAEVQYGGRITDDLDRELFITYSQQWLTEAVFQPNYIFNTTFTEYHYAIPDTSEHSKFMDHIGTFPVKDSPIIFGLHPNADLTYRLNESIAMLTTLVDTQPKEASSAGGKSREDEVREKIEKELLPQLPPDFLEADIEERLKQLRGPKGLNDVGKLIPLNVFLFQELQRFQMILTIVRRTLTNMVDAIEGSIIMTPDLVDAIDSVFDFRVPKNWCYDPTGAEIAWLMPTLGSWMKGLLDRHFQLNNWISKERPQSFWLTGFFNPQGFLTSMKQEVTRQRKAQQWSLDEVEYATEVLKETIQGDDGKIEGRQLQQVTEGVLIHGLYLEGAGWNKAEKRLEESQPKELYYTFPIIHVFAVSTAPVTGPGQGAKAKQDDRGGEKQQYSCPVYKYARRNDKYLIFRVFLKCDVPGGANALPKGVTPPMNWKLKGVALLCSKE